MCCNPLGLCVAIEEIKYSKLRYEKDSTNNDAAFEGPGLKFALV